ncbi:hypothetical protein LTR53_020426, partial [Teratosphaeriaceae sp. CCFEE 6253]
QDRGGGVAIAACGARPQDCGSGEEGEGSALAAGRRQGGDRGRQCSSRGVGGGSRDFQGEGARGTRSAEGAPRRQDPDRGARGADWGETGQL